MRKILYFHLMLLMLFGSSVVGIAQRKKPANASPPPSSNDYFPERWKEFSPEDGSFKILFPDTPKESPVDDNASPDRYPLYYVTYKSFISYMAMYIEYPGDIESPASAKDIFDRARNSGLLSSAEARQSPRVVREVNISVEGHPGRFLQVDLAGSKVARQKFIVIKNRFYYLEVETPRVSSRKGIDYEKIAMHFLDSFRPTVKQEKADFF